MMTVKSRRNPPKHRIRAILRADGRSVVWLARQTGYSTDHIHKVDSGGHPGSIRFWKLVNGVLGRDAA